MLALDKWARDSNGAVVSQNIVDVGNFLNYL
jgi:hypothetical protein